MIRWDIDDRSPTPWTRAYIRGMWWRRDKEAFEGTQHTASLHGDRCVDNAVTAYLVDGTLPADGTRCSPS